MAVEFVNGCCGRSYHVAVRPNSSVIKCSECEARLDRHQVHTVEGIKVVGFPGDSKRPYRKGFIRALKQDIEEGIVHMPGNLSPRS